MTPEFYTEIALDYNKGTSYLEKGNIRKAHIHLTRALKKFQFKEGYVNLGNVYRCQCNYKEMFKCYKAAVDPKMPYLQPPQNIKADTLQHAYNNLGLAYYMIGDDSTAEKYYHMALARDEEFWECVWNLSTCLLRRASAGETELFPTAWSMYNARFLKSSPVVPKNRKEGLQYWVPGTHVDSIIVLAEQGIGDNIMFGRYLAELSEYGRVIVQCDNTTRDIFSDYECVNDASECSAMWAYPMCSLAGALGGMPAGDWLRGKFGTREFGDGFNVGIVWAGRPTHANDHNRSVSLGRFSRLAKYANLYSLSPGFKSTSLVTGLDLRSWTDTAVAINGLDLVIGVDTSVMHMCGSLGARGWLLQPAYETDFRWGTGGRSVWYNSIDIYENPGDWAEVFSRIEKDLADVTYK